MASCIRHIDVCREKKISQEKYTHICLDVLSSYIIHVSETEGFHLLLPPRLFNCDAPVWSPAPPPEGLRWQNITGMSSPEDTSHPWNQAGTIPVRFWKIGNCS